MDCLAKFESGNYVFSMCRIMEKKGYIFEVVSTPCQIAKEGCGYCLRFPMEYMDMVIDEGKLNRMVVHEIYKIIPGLLKNKYEKVYP